ncbi:MAG TPA: hydroxysqualene dehydroxylase HpnE, partial [Tepidisphaeraceae bacterium]|nr:hydroxysqualene dehydroxylase HpnE [Tepidisphaeraceae bacterium]
QHVLLGCCTNLLDFYHRIGASNLIRFERTIHFRDARGQRHDLYGIENWPAPLNLGPSLLQFSALSWPERIAFSRAMLAMLRMGHTGRKALSDVPFGKWLDEHNQPESLVQKFYDPIIVSGLNEETRRASAEYAIQIFQDAMLSNSSGYVMGVPNCPLSQLYANVPIRDVRLGVRASELRTEGDRVVDCDAAVLATNFHSLDKLVPADWFSRDSRFASLQKIESVPILGAHLWFDRPVLAEPHAAMMSGPLQWLFRKDDSGTAVHGVISAARDWVGRDKDEMLREFESQIRATIPEAKDAKLIRGVIVIEKRATFSPLPDVDRYRPSQSPQPGDLQNLFLAGDYTKTGWPATMEGAVRSGYLVADAVVSRLGLHRESFLKNDLPIQWPARFMGLNQ